MSFFCTSNEKIKKQIVTLQVRIPIIEKWFCRKKMSLFASASLTLEAALVLPLFLYAGVILMLPFRIMDVQRQVQAIAEQVSEEIGQAAYLSSYIETEEFWNTAAAFAYAETAVRSKTGELPVHQVSLLRSSLLEDGEIVDLVVDYEIKMPFSVFGLEHVKQTSRSYRRAWVGEDGRSDGTWEEEEEDKVMVYIGKRSTRYHVSVTCHYLYNDFIIIPVGEIEEWRNHSGRRYTPCNRCGSFVPEDVIYVMKSGRRYHTTTSCSAINAYVTEVPKSQVEYLGACSYCSGGR